MWKCMWGRRETRGKAGSFIWMMKCAGCETYFNKKDHLWILYEYETGQFKLLDNTKDGMIYGGCNCGNCHITIASNGDIMACRRVMDSRVANKMQKMRIKGMVQGMSGGSRWNMRQFLWCRPSVLENKK